MKVLVTGATGFIGSNLCHRLINEGHQVCILARKSSDLSELKGLDIILKEGDITQLESVKNAAQGVDTVFHLAGLIAYRKKDRQQMQQVNVVGTQNVITACLNNNVNRLVYMSSVVAVGAGFSPKEILNEASPYNLAHLNLGYFETKRSAENLVVKAFKQHGLPVLILNPSTVYGPSDAKKGSRSTQLKVAKGQLPFYTSGGVSIAHIDDVLDATLACWNHGRHGERYILSGENILIKDLFTLIAEAAGVRPPAVRLPNMILSGLGKIGDQMNRLGYSTSLSSENAIVSQLYHWFDHTKATRELNYKSRPAREAIFESVKWAKENQLI